MLLVCVGLDFLVFSSGQKYCHSRKKALFFFGRWGRVSVIYSLGVGLKDPALVRFHVIKKKVRFKMLYMRKYAEMKKRKKSQTKHTE